MSRRLWRSLAVIAAGGLALAGTQVTADATPSSQAPAVHHVTGDRAAIHAKWTPERMRSAIPLDTLTVDAKALATVPAGSPHTVTPTKPEAAPRAFPSGGGAWTGGGAVVHTAGRVFFTYSGRTASCSGDAVTSGNKSVVLTAGHCVKLDGAFHTDWVFVPAYNNGNAPYGTWTANTLLTTPQWQASEDINYDVGAAVVDPLGGQLLTDVVGGQGVAFNQARGQNMYAFGYPAADPYDGTALIYCSGPVFDAFISDGIGMDCDMTGGASGGPWFLSFNEATGTGSQNSVNSYKINFIPFWMFGPYFGTDAQNLYNTAAAS
jgi:V8-like Glu-specific endopeptidase